MNQNEENSKFAKTTISWYPGHMEKTKNELKTIMPVVNIVFELIDARIPYSSKISDIDNILRNTSKVLVMTKKDLCDLSVTNKWVKYYEDKGYNVALINLNEQNDYKKVINIINELVEKINNKRKEKGLKEKDIKAVVVGIPNVGKSTFINKLAGKKIANVGNNPGVTKKNVWLNTTYKMSVLDTPGVLMPRFDNQTIALNLAAMTAIRTEVLPINEVAYHILTMLNKYYPKILLDRYGLEKLTDDYESDFEKISKKLNIKSSHGIDYNRINNFIINDVKLEHIKNITFDRGI